MKWQKILKFAGIAFATFALAGAVGCSKKKDKPAGDDDDDDNQSATVAVTLSDTGDTNITAGECAAFTITGTNTTFTSGVQVQLGYSSGSVPISIPADVLNVASDTEIQVGQPGVEGATPCWCFGPGPFADCEPVPSGPVDLVIAEGGGTPFTTAGAFTLSDIAPTSLTPGTPSSASLDREAATNYFTADVTNNMSVTTLVQGTADWVPFITGYTSDYTGLISLGTVAMMRDLTQAGGTFTMNPAIADLNFGGGSGFDYDLTIHEITPVDLTGKPAADVDTWDDPANAGTENPNIEELNVTNGTPEIQVFTGTMNGLADDYDPNPNQDGTTCVSQADVILGTDPAFPIQGIGADAVYKYTAEADGNVLIAVQGDGDGAGLAGSADFTLYVVTDPVNNLQDGMDGTCEAGIDFFGDFATDGLVLSVTNGTVYYIFVDFFEQPSGIDLTTTNFNLLVDETI